MDEDEERNAFYEAMKEEILVRIDGTSQEVPAEPPF